MKTKLNGIRARGFRILGKAAPVALLAGGVASAQATDPEYQTAIITGLGTANTAGTAVLAAGAVIVVSLIVWAVIKKFSHAAK